MKCRVSSVQSNSRQLYPAELLTLIRKKGDSALVETSEGARQWVHVGFLVYPDSKLEDGPHE